MTELRERLNNYVAARERAEQQSSVQMIENRTESHKPMTTAEPLVAESQAMGYKGERRKTTPNCRYCDGDHWNDECPRYTAVETRKNKIKGSCYICFKPFGRGIKIKMTRVASHERIFIYLTCLITFVYRFGGENFLTAK